MGSSGRSREPFDEPMVIVRVADEVNQVLTGHPGARYESPPQGRKQAVALVEILLNRTGGSLNGAATWTCPIAGGRRVITLREQDDTRDGADGCDRHA